MNVKFIAPDPRQRAKPILDNGPNSAGTEHLAIVFAFLTPGGIELSGPMPKCLRLDPSFIVVAWEPQTTLDSLSEMELKFGTWKSLRPPWLPQLERVVGSGLMHSKVFFAKNGKRCQLWAGSHNLTASASQGVNCEAAVLLDGTSAKIRRRRSRPLSTSAVPRPCPSIRSTPPRPPTPEQTLVIHAECSTILKSLPWYIHLRPATTDYDKAIARPAAVWLYLYNHGTLHMGLSRPKATGAASRHPRRQEVSWVLAYLLRWEPVGKTACLLTLLMDNGVE